MQTVDRSAANATYSEYGELKREESFAANGLRILFQCARRRRLPAASLQAIEAEFGSYENG